MGRNIGETVKNVNLPTYKKDALKLRGASAVAILAGD